MKVKAMARISGRPGDRDIGEEFELDDAFAQELIDKGLVEKMASSKAPVASKTAVEG